jgi:hypothetical protein
MAARGDPLAADFFAAFKVGLSGCAWAESVFEVVSGFRNRSQAGSNRDKWVERNGTAIEAHWDSGWSVLGQQVNGTGTG